MNSTERFWEIDFLRGIAIVLMIAYHAVFDLTFFGALDWNVTTGAWWFFARGIATTFILLVGISLTLSHAKGRSFAQFATRGVTIFVWGILITAATWFYLKEGFILFGVLHFIGVSIVLGYFFLKYTRLNLIIGLVLIAAGAALSSFTVSFPWLLWLGLAPTNLYTVDYFPLLPWFGVVLLGICLGNTLYKDHKRQFSLVELSDHAVVKFFTFLGQKSLILYLIHQPILMAFLYVVVL